MFIHAVVLLVAFILAAASFVRAFFVFDEDRATHWFYTGCVASLVVYILTLMGDK